MILAEGVSQLQADGDSRLAEAWAAFPDIETKG